MERHRCKLCYRNFANGKALGGHMRSHMMKLYAAKKSSEIQQPLDENLQESDDEFLSVHSYSTTSDDDDDEEEEEFEVVIQDRESETGSFRSNFRRSKRVRKSRISDFNDHEVLSSISDTSPEEHVAHCLIMLSRDKWNNIEENEVNDIIDDDSEDFKMAKVIKNSTSSSNKVRGKYRCETCNKLFKSYQALGGHRASHKKIKLNNSGGGSTAAVAVAVVEEKLHECPFCDRVFTSGQALGGHKRSHFIGGSRVVSGIKENVITRKIGGSLSIDLNLPAPVDDDEISQISDQLLEN